MHKVTLIFFSILQREEIGPSGYTIVKPSSQSYMDSYNYQSYQQQQQQYQQQQSYVLKSNSLSNFSNKIDDRHSDQIILINNL